MPKHFRTFGKCWKLLEIFKKKKLHFIICIRSTIHSLYFLYFCHFYDFRFSSLMMSQLNSTTQFTSIDQLLAPSLRRSDPPTLRVGSAARRSAPSKQRGGNNEIRAMQIECCCCEHVDSTQTEEYNNSQIYKNYKI